MSVIGLQLLVYSSDRFAAIPTCAPTRGTVDSGTSLSSWSTVSLTMARVEHAHASIDTAPWYAVLRISTLVAHQVYQTGTIGQLRAVWAPSILPARRCHRAATTMFHCKTCTSASHQLGFHLQRSRARTRFAWSGVRRPTLRCSPRRCFKRSLDRVPL